MTAATRPVEEQLIEARLNAAREDGWYGYDAEAQGDVEYLLAEVERLRDAQRRAGQLREAVVLYLAYPTLTGRRQALEEALNDVPS